MATIYIYNLTMGQKAKQLPQNTNMPAHAISNQKFFFFDLLHIDIQLACRIPKYTEINNKV